MSCFRLPVSSATRLTFALTAALFVLAGCDSEPADKPAETIEPPAECAVAADCPAPANPCADAVCTAGKCAATTRADDAACDDGDVCTSGDVCKSGLCVTGPTKKVCDDGNPCTEDVCFAKTGCAFNPKPTMCDDDNPCTSDTCEPADGSCKHAAVSGFCDDGDQCTIGDQCQDSKCTAGQARVCDDKNPCTDDSCDPDFGCTAKNNAFACEDGNACTEGDQCKDGICVTGAGKKACNDKNPCTTDSCDPTAGCVTAPLQSECDDGDACTVGDACQDGACLPGAPTACDDQNACTDDSCDKATGCVFADNTVSCDDGDACTTADACLAGACTGGAAKSCDDGNLCTDDSCDPATGCQNADNMAPCTDGSACTTGDMCMAGQCAPGGATNCDDGNACTNDSCDPATGCAHANNTAACTDGNACTENDVCKDGLCVAGAAKSCNDGNACTTDACDPAKGCLTSVNALACEDGNLCTENDTCKDEACTPGAAKVCDDKNVCTTDSCDPAKGCVVVNNTLACDDGDASTGNDVCANGTCKGTPIGPTCQAYCDAVTANCTGGNQQYASKGACMDYCQNLGKLPAGTKADTTGNTVGCRTYHAGLAVSQPAAAAAHCTHAGPSGGNMCGTWCDNYCHLAQSNCTAGNQLYATLNDCTTKCGGAATTGTPGDTSGATVQCMITQLGLAGKDAAAATTYCPSGKIPNDAGGKCLAAPAPVTHDVKTQGFAFSPKDITIKAGDSIKFDIGNGHTATEVEKAIYDDQSKPAVAKDGGFKRLPGNLQPVPFPTPGVFYYVCEPHFQGGMKGTVTVQ